MGRLFANRASLVSLSKESQPYHFSPLRTQITSQISMGRKGLTGVKEALLCCSISSKSMVKLLISGH